MFREMMLLYRHEYDPFEHETFSQCCFNGGPPKATLAQRLVFAGTILVDY